MNQPTSPPWSLCDAEELYAIDQWSSGYFGLSEEGEVTVRLQGDAPKPKSVSIPKIIEEIRDRGKDLPILLRFGELLESRIRLLNESFRKAIIDEDYEGTYQGVFPLKVNQQQEAINHITKYGRPYNYGLEVGSKPELIAAVAHLNDPDAYLVCNGYKDAEFIDLALRAQKVGVKVILVIEMPSEVDTILERSALLELEPMLGIRVRLATKGSGHWSDSAGEKSVFGLHINQLMNVVDHLRENDKLHCLRMLHFHQGSQIPNIRAIREATMEATRIYADLVKEGAPMGLIDLGGGLAVDYEGNQSSAGSGANYGIEEYCADMINVIKNVADDASVPHPDIISESGRAIVAYYSVLVFNIVDVNRFFPDGEPPPRPENAPEVIINFYDAWEHLSQQNMQECFNDALFYRNQLHQLHAQGNVTLRERALGENLYGHLMKRCSELLETTKHVPEDMKEVEGLGVDYYYGNFSLFQSLPDVWAIQQVLPVTPLHRLDEQPTRRAVLADITCDCDGRIDKFISKHEVRRSLPVHELKPDEDYLIGVFLVGAYQETLGALHNLIGDTNVVSVTLDDKGQARLSHEVEGDSVGEVLTYVEYELKDLRTRFRRIAEEAVKKGHITGKERREFTQAYDDGLRSHTYYQS
ncbi:biosynthetic arginine decarboxylase [Verrucomicrobiales bacterium]|nr:biosynthetic arginine decarboxylase [Verrucomicrobiales bacterium]MDA7614324.1 biosynthetic arginine decarboxylase [Verrucomicrobiales bacterium]